MIARLWWKEARQIWPIWVFLAAMGVATQGVAAWYLERDANAVVMAVIALGFTFLYVFLIAAAVFAGERETGTLTLLDALPVERWRVWTAKSSFALATSAALGIVLCVGVLLMGLLRNPLPWENIVVGGVLLLAGLGWGLFWSSFLNNALLAAALSISSVCVSLVFLDISDISDRMGPMSLFGRSFPGHLIAAIATTIASAAIFLLSAPPKRSWSRRNGAPRAAIVERPDTEADAFENRRLSRFWPYSLPRLIWQTLRQIRSVGVVLVLIGVVAPIVLTFAMGMRSDPVLWEVLGFSMYCGGVLTIVAGVSVFNAENRGRTHRFLTQHGARPGLVWFVRVPIWLSVATPIWLMAGVAFALGRMPTGPGATFLSAVGHLTIGFAIATLCGMVFRRGITAGMIAVVLWLAVSLPAGFLVGFNLLPAQGLIGIALAILAVSWGWSGQWMLDRPGTRRWASLGLLTVGTVVAVSSVYIGDRVWGVPAFGEGEAAEVFQFSRIAAVGDGGRNAAGLYVEAMNAYESGSAISMGESPTSKGDSWERRNEPALKLLREAAMMPVCRFVDIGKFDLFGSYQGGTGPFTPTHATGYSHSLGLLDRPLTDSARMRRDGGDLKGAWAEIETLFRMGRQISGVAPMVVNLYGQIYERRALGMAMQWAADARQTEESLQAARSAFLNLPAMPDAADAIRAEALILRNTTELPRPALVEGVMRFLAEPRRIPESSQKPLADFLTTPWEIARARRVFDLLMASKILDAQRWPWQVDGQLGEAGSWRDFVIDQGIWGARIISAEQQEALLKSTPLSHGIYGNFNGYIDQWNHNRVRSLALDLIFRLRIWQVRHDGRLPETLAELAAREGDLEPPIVDPYSPTVDPYSPIRSPFGYLASNGQDLLPLGVFHTMDQQPFEGEGLSLGSSRMMMPVSTAGCRLLYSIGPNLVDDRARADEQHLGVTRQSRGQQVFATANPIRQDIGDIIFPLKDNVKPPAAAK